jgi:hypothetical protein
VAAVEAGQISVSVAATLARQPADVQRFAVAEIADGRPVVEVLVAAGLQEREPPRFDDQTLTRALTQLRRLLDLRAAAYGPCDAYRLARDQLELASRALGRWRIEHLNEPVPVVTDAKGRRVPVKLVPTFQTAEEIKILLGQLEAIGRQVQGLSRREGGELIRTQDVLPHLDKARKALADAQAQEVCRWCYGRGLDCSACHRRGWMPADGTPDWR